MRLRYPLAGVLLSIVAVLAIVPIAQAQDDPYGDGLTCGDLRGWFREHFPRETELRDAILDRIEPCAVDDWLNHGMVFLAMNEVDGDDAGALAAMGKVFFESRNGHHVTSGQMKGWIDAWLAFHDEQAAVIEKAAEDAENAVAEAEAAAAAAAEAAAAAAEAEDAADAFAAAAAAAAAAEDAAAAAAEAEDAADAAAVAAAANAAAGRGGGRGGRVRSGSGGGHAAAAAAANAAAAAAEAAEAAASIAAAERPPWPEPTRTGETFQSQQVMCVGENQDGSCNRFTYDPSAPPITCHIMSDGYVECEQ